MAHIVIESPAYTTLANLQKYVDSLNQQRQEKALANLMGQLWQGQAPQQQAQQESWYKPPQQTETPEGIASAYKPQADNAFGTMPAQTQPQTPAENFFKQIQTLLGNSEAIAKAGGVSKVMPMLGTLYNMWNAEQARELDKWYKGATLEQGDRELDLEQRGQDRTYEINKERVGIDKQRLQMDQKKLLHDIQHDNTLTELKKQELAFLINNAKNKQELEQAKFIYQQEQDKIKNNLEDRKVGVQERALEYNKDYQDKSLELEKQKATSGSSLNSTELKYHYQQKASEILKDAYQQMQDGGMVYFTPDQLHALKLGGVTDEDLKAWGIQYQVVNDNATSSILPRTVATSI